MNPSYLIVLALSGLAATPVLAPKAAAPNAVTPRHCQIPCGIYGDRTRIDLLLEDVATIEKGMKTLGELEAADGTNYNQIVRWVANKDQHAANIQQQCLDYWLAQRIKAPKDAAGQEKYVKQLTFLHQIIVSAMKCKQTTDPSHAAAIRAAAMGFAETYFSAEDLSHIKDHHK